MPRSKKTGLPTLTDVEQAEVNKMPAGLTELQRRFVLFYCADPTDMPGAARKAGSKAAKGMSLANTASAIKRHPLVRQAIAVRRAQLEHATGITQARTLHELSRLAYADPRLLFDVDGNPIPIEQLDDDAAAIVAGYKRTQRDVKDNTGQVVETIVTHEYKLPDKNSSLEKLMRHQGLFEADHGQLNSPLAKLVEAINQQGSNGILPAAAAAAPDS